MNAGGSRVGSRGDLVLVLSVLVVCLGCLSVVVCLTLLSPCLHNIIRLGNLLCCVDAFVAFVVKLRIV